MGLTLSYFLTRGSSLCPSFWDLTGGRFLTGLFSAIFEYSSSFFSSFDSLSWDLTGGSFLTGLFSTIFEYSSSFFSSLGSLSWLLE